MNSERYLDYGITVLLIIVVIALVVSDNYNVKDKITELYFSNITNLPKYISNNESFEFGIHNMENSRYDYEVLVSAFIYSEINATEPSSIINISQFKIILDNKETKVFSESIGLSNFSKAKIKVSIKNGSQEIYFWTFFAKEFRKYDDYGYGMLDCVKELRVTPFSTITVYAKGTNTSGIWPKMEFWYDGQRIRTDYVETPEKKDIASFFYKNLNNSIGKHTIDIMFINDFSNRTVKEDRNLYIQNISIDNKIFTQEYLIRDSGVKEKAFDCQNIARGGTLYGIGTVRLRLEVI